VVEFVTELQGKLQAPLEVRDFDVRSAERHYVFAPEWTLSVLKECAFDNMPEPLSHTDHDRVHLVSLRTGLTRDSIALFNRGAS
jgi:hypothetical protein